MGHLGTSVLLCVLYIAFSFPEAIEGEVQFLYYPVQVTPASVTTYLRRTPGKSVHFQVRNHDDGSYHFGYDADTLQNDKSFREEKRDAFGTVTGSYGYVDPDGVLRITHYIADRNGYRTVMSNQQPLGLRLNSEPIQIIGPIPRPFTDLFQG